MTMLAVAISLIQVNEDESETILQSRTFEAASVPDQLLDGETPKSPKVYGITKIMQDRNSQESDPAAKFEGMCSTFDNALTQGLWKEPSEARGPRKTAVDPVLIQAVAEIKSISLAQAAAALQKITADERKAIAANPIISEAMARIALEVGAAEVDLTSFG
jgi:hypothetical protein